MPAELERSAGRAPARGGLPAAAAFLYRAVALSLDPMRQTARLVGPRDELDTWREAASLTRADSGGSGEPAADQPGTVWEDD